MGTRQILFPSAAVFAASVGLSSMAVAATGDDDASPATNENHRFQVGLHESTMGDRTTLGAYVAGRVGLSTWW